MIAKLDMAVLRQTKRVADWIDYRWHINTYMIASYIFRFVSFCLIAVIALDFIEHKAWAIRIFLVVVNIPISLLVMWQSDKAKRAGEKWERNPGTIPSEAYGQILMPPSMRLFPLILGVVMIFIALPADIGLKLSWPLTALDCFFWAWNVYDGMAGYFLAIPPSTRSRKPKKARDWSFGLTLQPIGGRS